MKVEMSCQGNSRRFGGVDGSVYLHVISTLFLQGSYRIAQGAGCEQIAGVASSPDRVIVDNDLNPDEICVCVVLGLSQIKAASLLS